MILGIGIDLVDIRRIEQSLERHGKRFENRIYTESEQAHARGLSENTPTNIASFYAKRFAAKEACLKALGTGHKSGVYLLDIEIVSEKSGMPAIAFNNGASKRLMEMTPPGMLAKAFLTITDEYPYAQAQVIICALVA